MTNVIEFKINEGGHAIIKYVDENGVNKTFDLTENISKALRMVEAQNLLTSMQYKPGEYAGPYKPIS